MMFSVPQFIDVEDKIAGPFTAKQLGWLFAMGGILLVLYGLFDLGLFIASGFPVALLFLAFAFYKPNGQPFSLFLFHAILFVFRPKVAMWSRPVRLANTAKLYPEDTLQTEAVVTSKRVSVRQISDIAKSLDGN